MTMFYDELKHYDWDDTTRRIAAKTARDVEVALGKEHDGRRFHGSDLAGPEPPILSRWRG